ncbi:LysE family translocator [Alphaproteobacteria bacterium]|jgi:threonine/homoserine/homoserine lactone efflux protein|nr:LysE family translocator [Alphaproteobacteria bacterium]
MYEVFLALLSGWVVFYFAVFLPGPNTFFVASVGMSGDKHQIWGAAIGTAIGSFTWCLLATTGISFLISNIMGWGFYLLKVLASAYMVYLAYQIGKQYFSDQNQLIQSTNEKNFISSMKRAVIVAYTNPKAFAFWSALATIKFSDNLNFQIAFIFALGSFFISAMNYSIIGHFFGMKKFSNYFTRPKNFINLIFAGLFLFVAVEIWLLK